MVRVEVADEVGAYVHYTKSRIGSPMCLQRLVPHERTEYWHSAPRCDGSLGMVGRRARLGACGAAVTTVTPAAPIVNSP